MRGRAVLSVVLLVAGVLAGAWVLQRAAVPARPINPTRLFEQVLSHVQRFGVDSVSEAELYRRAANGLLWQLDDEQAMLVPAGTDPATLDAPDPGGLGLLLATRDGVVEVLGVLPGSPADDAGLRQGDLLFQLDGQPVDPNRRLELRRQLEGAPGTSVTVAFRRPGLIPLATARLQRGQPARSVVVGARPVLEPGIGYVAVPLLGPEAPGLVRAAVEQQVRAGARGLMLDLRAASSGGLPAAVEVASLFLPQGTPVVRIEGRSAPGDRLATPGPPAFPELPLLVLVDVGTGDAAEVLAAALQEADRALLVGAGTFGRGRSAGVFPLGSRFSVRLSTDRWVTPQGRVIQADALGADSLAAPATVRSVGGRALVDGRGIVPDSLVVADSLDDGARRLVQGLGMSLPVFRDSLRAVVRRSPGSPVADLRARLAAATQGIGVAGGDLDGAARFVDRELAAELARREDGVPALVTERARGDGVVARAVRLLRAARDARALVGLR